MTTAFKGDSACRFDSCGGLSSALGYTPGAVFTDLEPNQIVGKPIVFEPIVDPLGTITIYEPPQAGAIYGLGADFAYGLEGRDFDCFKILKRVETDTRFRAVEVAHAVGWWGELSDRILYGLAFYYGGVFIVGERQVGLPTLRRLYTNYKYPWIYYEKDEETESRYEKGSGNRKFGHFKSGGDLLLRNLRLATQEGRIDWNTQSTIDQARKMKWVDPRLTPTDDRVKDYELKIKLDGGGSPDEVMALMYAWHALNELPKYKKPDVLFLEGTLGAILGHNEFLIEEAGFGRNPATWIRHRNGRGSTRGRNRR